MSGIHKVPKNRRGQKIEPPKIVGGNVPASAEPRTPKVLDQNTRQRPVQIETTEHGEVVSVVSHTRTKPKKNDPDVRLRSMTADEKEAWRKVKQGEWED